MDSKKLEALLAAIETGSLTAAADELGYTQSGLTHMMNALERELGLSLLVRSKSGVQLSSAGQELLGDMRAFVDAAKKFEEHAGRLMSREASTIRLGAYSSMARCWLPQIVAQFRKTCPDVDVNIRMGTVSEIYNAVKNDELDCAMASYESVYFQNLAWESLRNDPLVAVLPADYRDDIEKYDVRRFAEGNFLMPSAGFDLDILPLFAQYKLQPNVRYTNLDDATIASMVSLGLGTSILSELCISTIRERVVALPLDPPAYRELGIILRDAKKSDRVIKKFIRCAQSTVTAMYNEKK